MKTCSVCKEKLDRSCFHKSSKNKDGLRTACKECRKGRYSEVASLYRKKYYQQNREQEIERAMLYYQQNREQIIKYSTLRNKELRKCPKTRKILSAYSRSYAIRKRDRVPDWADLEKIKTIYKNCPEGMQVDHIIPLHGKDVSGLHVSTNLQYLTKSENASKGNRFDLNFEWRY